MPILVIARADIKRLCGIDPADTSQDAAIDATLAAEQIVHEFALDPAVLQAAPSDTNLLATLSLGVAETIAGSFLQQGARTPDTADDLRIGSLAITATRAESQLTIGEKLASQGQARLAPYLKASQTLVSAATGGVGDPQADFPLLLGLPPVPSVFDAPFDSLAEWEATL